MQTPLCTELHVDCWHWAIAKPSAWKRNHPWSPAPTGSLSTENSPLGGQTEKKEAGRGAVQRVALRRWWKLGFSFFSQAVLIILNVISMISIAMRPFRFIRVASWPFELFL